jgi:hypothetical protein
MIRLTRHANRLRLWLKGLVRRRVESSRPATAPLHLEIERENRLARESARERRIA